MPTPEMTRSDMGLVAIHGSKNFCIITHDEYGIGEYIEWTAREPCHVDLNGYYLVLSRKGPDGYHGQWRYEVKALPKNPMTYQDMMDIST